MKFIRSGRFPAPPSWPCRIRRARATRSDCELANSATASPDLLRSLLSTFIQALMGAEADALCGAGYGERAPPRSNRRNGYRCRDFDTRAGTIDVAIPKLRQGSYFPLEARAWPTDPPRSLTRLRSRPPCSCSRGRRSPRPLRSVLVLRPIGTDQKGLADVSGGCSERICERNAAQLPRWRETRRDGSDGD